MHVLQNWHNPQFKTCPACLKQPPAKVKRYSLEIPKPRWGWVSHALMKFSFNAPFESSTSKWQFWSTSKWQFGMLTGNRDRNPYFFPFSIPTLPLAFKCHSILCSDKEESRLNKKCSLHPNSNKMHYAFIFPAIEQNKHLRLIAHVTTQNNHIHTWQVMWGFVLVVFVGVFCLFVLGFFIF